VSYLHIEKSRDMVIPHLEIVAKIISWLFKVSCHCMYVIYIYVYIIIYIYVIKYNY
jgi:hypothetical protein